MNQYIPIIIVIAFAFLLTAIFIVLSHILGPRKFDVDKLSTYECGIDPVRDARGRIPVKFYLIAVIFLIFDIEVVFMYPWAVLFRKLGLFGFVEMMIFILVLVIGFVYIWKKGALEWEK